MSAKYHDQIEQGLRDLVQTWGPKTPLRDACEYSLMTGGKRIRPIITLMVGETLGKDVLPAALCVELMHTSSLIADDLPCMDDDDLRRGKPSCHREFDEATALLASFSLIAAGYSLVADNPLAVKNVSKTGGIHGLTGGQYLDINPPAQDKETYFQTIHEKTGALFESALVLGWVFGGGDPARLPEIEEAAVHLGRVFQMCDDLDDLEQDKRDGNVMNAFLLLGETEAAALLEKERAAFRTSMEALGLNNVVALFEEQSL